MARQSITFTKPNDEWLKAQLDSQEYTSKSEIVNDLIRRERERQKEIEWIRIKLLEGEQSGISKRTPEQIRQAVRKEMYDHGEI